MNNAINPDQFLNAMKHSQAVMVEMAARSLECMEKHMELNLKAAKANLADATEAAHQLIGVKDASELYAVSQNVAQPSLSKAASYGRNVYSINAETAAEFAKLVESRIEEANKAMATAINDLSKNAPAGSEGLVAMIKSAFAASNSAFDAINKASKQVVEMVETNVEAAAKAGEAAVATASPKAGRRRAAAE
ncbi:MAG: phasin family protein [Betaproteobacteria bacterium]|nr:phasin family protein [Betaproteobacteria bacterium]NBT74538.1 phasin family protein [Betaproteobacteria bacterium]NBY13510.1 phasin family protein [Betaproteobacteria bacterium]NCA16521.1 phasin family protein [Betaproteobacteria bacterium]NDF04256.1 phasin family protein [Betaproteobacteria bacterium]